MEVSGLFHATAVLHPGMFLLFGGSRAGQDVLPLPGFEPRTAQPVADVHPSFYM
jgi:hypothetical protein